MSWWSDLWPYIAALLPTAGVLFLFVVIVKHIIEGDRRERAAVREWEESEDARERAQTHPPSEERSQ